MRRLKVLSRLFTDPPRAFISSIAALAGVVRDAGHEPRALTVFRKGRIDDVAERVESLSPDVLASTRSARPTSASRETSSRARTWRSRTEDRMRVPSCSRSDGAWPASSTISIDALRRTLD